MDGRRCLLPLLLVNAVESIRNTIDLIICMNEYDAFIFF